MTLSKRHSGLAFFVAGDFDRAISDYDHALLQNPILERAFNGRGRAYARKQLFDAAVRDFTEAINLNPNDENAFYERGFAFFQMQVFSNAISDCTSALKLDPKRLGSLRNARGLLQFTK